MINKYHFENIFNGQITNFLPHPDIKSDLIIH